MRTTVKLYISIHPSPSPPITSKHEDSVAITEMGNTLRSSPKILIYKLKIYFLDLIWLGYMLCQRKCIFWGFYWIPSMECSNTWMTFSFPQFPISILIINKSYEYLSYFNPINLITQKIWSIRFFVYKHTEYSDYYHKESPLQKALCQFWHLTRRYCFISGVESAWATL